MKYADLLGKWLVELGYTHCFFVAGGGIMHLLDGVRSRFECIPVVHEVAAGIAAEHFNESTRDKRAFALVTTGPGLTNIVTAIGGAFVEHRELLVIAGQVKSTDLLKPPQRQRGVQEIDGTALCKPITVHSECLRAPISRERFVSIVESARGPHPGPVLLEVCLDVQGAKVDPVALEAGSATPPSLELAPDAGTLATITSLLNQAKRPLLLMGGLVTRKVAAEVLPALEASGIPVATTTSAIDRVPTASKIFAGRPGTWGGQRAANLVLAQADVVIALGAQLDLQQTGFNYQQYAPAAKLVHVFPSQVELDREGPPATHKVLASADPTLKALVAGLRWRDEERWGDYVREVRELVPVLEPANVSAPDFINSFKFLGNLSRATRPDDVLALCSSGGSFTGALQNYEIARGQLATTSAAHASMGYGLSTAIGAAFARPGKRIVLTEGEGGFSQNLQELGMVKRHKLPIKIFLMENGGYASIRATQKKFFGGAYLGCDESTGLGFPHWKALFEAYDIPCRVLGNDEIDEATLRAQLDHREGPEAWVVPVDPTQPNWPAVATVLSPTGALTSGPLSDMLPKLPEEMLARVGRYLPRG